MIKKNYNTFTTFIPSVFDGRDLRNPPYRYYASCTANFLCILTRDKDIIAQFDADASLEQRQNEILAINPKGHDLVVCFHSSYKKPIIVHDFQSNDYAYMFSFTPKSHYDKDVLIMDRNGKVYTISTTTGMHNQLYIEQDCTSFINDIDKRITYDNRNLLLDLYYYAEFRGMGPGKEQDLNIDPLSLPLLEEKHVTDFKRLLTTEVKEPTVPAGQLPLLESSDRIFFSQVLNRIPKVDKETDIEVDLDLAAYMINRITVLPTGRVHFYLQISNGQAYNRSDYSALLGHEQFDVTLLA